MSVRKRIILLLAISTLMMIIGAYAKTQHWHQIKPLMLIGLMLQTATLFYALYHMATKKK